MAKTDTQVSALDNNGDTNIKRKTLKELWYGYYYSISYSRQLITEKTLKKFWPFPLYDKDKINLVFNALKRAILNKNFFADIADELMEKPWLDLYVEAAKIYPNYFRNHFYKNKKKYSKLISNYMFQVMLNTGDTSEETYLTYTDGDLFAITDGLFMVSKFWSTRNYYKVIKVINPFWALEIYQDTVNIYNQYLKDLELINNNVQDDIGKMFDNVKTLYGKLVVLDKIWEKINIRDNFSAPINYRPMIVYKEEILKILEDMFSLEDEDIIENISAIVLALHSVYTLDKNYNDFKKRSLEIYEKYKHNRIVAQDLRQLKRL
jgi:hypothetical protein